MLYLIGYTWATKWLWLWGFCLSGTYINSRIVSPFLTSKTMKNSIFSCAFSSCFFFSTLNMFLDVHHLILLRLVSLQTLSSYRISFSLKIEPFNQCNESFHLHLEWLLSSSVFRLSSPSERLDNTMNVSIWGSICCLFICLKTVFNVKTALYFVVHTF